MGLAVGWAVSMMLTLLLSMLAGLLIYNERFPETAVGYTAMAAVLLSSSLGATAAVKRIKRRRAYVCALSGALYYASLLAVTALFFGGQYSGMGVTALLVIAGCGSVILMGLRGERGGHMHGRKTGAGKLYKMHR